MANSKNFTSFWFFYSILFKVKGSSIEVNDLEYVCKINLSPRCTQGVKNNQNLCWNNEPYVMNIPDVFFVWKNQFHKLPLHPKGTADKKT